MTKPRRGRPPGTDALTPEVHASIVKWMEAGNYFETACQITGVAVRTARLWLRHGNKQKRGKYADFLHSVKKAEARAEARNVLRIETASAKQWQASAWLLERKHPERWARHDRHEITGKDGRELAVRIVKDGAAAVAAALGIDEGVRDGSETDTAETETDNTSTPHTKRPNNRR